MRVTTTHHNHITRSQLFHPHKPLSNTSISSPFQSVLPHFDEAGLTPNTHFYKHGTHPVMQVDTAYWQLVIDSALGVSLDELRRMDAVERPITVVAVSSTPQHFMMGNALWRGVPVRELLGDLLPRPDVKYAQFRSMNGYRTYLPVNLLDHALLAYEMNGERLSPEQGYPIRLVVPGVYDYKMPKWLTAIDLVADAPIGHYESQGLSGSGEVQTTSAILTPRARAVVDEQVYFSGVAFAGTRKVIRIELSIDDGEWMPVRFVDAVVGSWTRWQIDWTPPAAGDYVVKVRATDSAGFTQSVLSQDVIFPYGSSAIHSLVFRVAK